MVVDPGNLCECWSRMVQDAEQRYHENRNEETRKACRQALKKFSDLILRGKIPED